MTDELEFKEPEPKKYITRFLELGMNVETDGDIKVLNNWGESNE